MRDCPFRRNDQWFAKDLIRAREEFQFGMPEIARLREDIRKLVQGLSSLYLPWKKNNDRALKEERRKEKQERLEQLEAPSETSVEASSQVVVNGNGNDSAGLTATADASSNSTSSSSASRDNADASAAGRMKAELHAEHAGNEDTSSEEGTGESGKENDIVPPVAFLRSPYRSPGKIGSSTADRGSLSTKDELVDQI